MLAHTEWVPPPKDNYNTIKHHLSLLNSEAMLNGISYCYDVTNDIMYEWDDFKGRISKVGDSELRTRLLEENREAIQNERNKSRSLLQRILSIF